MKLIKVSPFLFLMLLGVALILFVARANQISDPSWEQPTMGTLCHITVSGSISKQKLDELREQIDAALQTVNERMSTWQPNTEISKFNAYRGTEPFAISPDFAAVVRRALEFSAATDGAFDPTVKPLVDHWGFGPEADAGSIDEIMQAVGWHKVRLENGTLIKMNPGLQLDLSAIAKGFGVDTVADVIRSAGRSDFLVEIGGEIVASGLNPKGKLWKVGVETPQAGEAFGEKIFQTLELKGRALATSGDYRRFRTREDGSLYSHIINPVTGMPAETDVASVSVLAESCMDADAIATALFVMGSEKSFQWLEKHPELDALLILHSADRTFTSKATAGFPED